MGIKTFAVTSDGAKHHSPNYAPLYDRIAQLQKQLARRVKGSNRWQRTRLRIAKLHSRIVDMRTDFLHKLSTKVTIASGAPKVVENQVVALEDLAVSGLVKNRKLSKAGIPSVPFVKGREKNTSGKYASSTDGKLLAKSAQNAVGIGAS